MDASVHARRIAFVTGPSGAGKTFVQERLAEVCGDIQTICFDRLFKDACYIAFPHYSGHPSHQKIWWNNVDQDLDFEAIFRTAIQKSMNEETILSSDLLIQGVQLRKTPWREAITSAIDVRPTDHHHTFVILPDANELLSLRSASTKEYHQTVASLEECAESVKRFRMFVDQHANSDRLTLIADKEEAVEKVHSFFSAT